MAGFNFIAPYYDSFAKLVFGKSLLKAQLAYIAQLPEKGNILFIGGGSGKILNDLLKNKKELQVDFIDLSENFISIAKRNLLPVYKSRVNFIVGSEQDIPKGKTYDGLLTFFVVDLFSNAEAEKFCATLVFRLKSGSVWLFADFISSEKKTQRFLLWSMYCFFRLFSGVRSGKSPDYRKIFKQHLFSVVEEKYYFHDMIWSCALKQLPIPANDVGS